MCLFRRPVAGKTRERQPLCLYALAVRHGLNKTCRESCCSCHGSNCPSPLAICWKPDCSAPPQPNLETISLSKHRCCHIFQLQDHFLYLQVYKSYRTIPAPKRHVFVLFRAPVFIGVDFFYLVSDKSEVVRFAYLDTQVNNAVYTNAGPSKDRSPLEHSVKSKQVSLFSLTFQCAAGEPSNPLQPLQIIP